MEVLQHQIQRVAAARHESSRLREALDAVRQAFETEHADLINAVQAAREAVSGEEAELRRLTLEAFHATGSKSPAGGVGIRVTTRLEYDPSQAFEWAQEHRIALQLDRGAFEKIAKASPLPFVTVLQEPQATIATDLSAHAPAVRLLEETPHV